jgi:hypothetical protein
VTDPLDSVLVALEQFGKMNDASTTDERQKAVAKDHYDALEARYRN